MNKYIFGICHPVLKEKTWIPKLIRNFVNNNNSRRLKIIDIGAGYGDKCKFLVERGHYVLAIEPDEKLLNYIKSKVPEADVLRAVVEYLPIRSNSFEVIVFWNVVMFVTDLDKAVSNIIDVSKEGANLFIAYYKLKDGKKLMNYIMSEYEFLMFCRRFGQILNYGKRFRDSYYAQVQVMKDGKSR